MKLVVFAAILVAASAIADAACTTRDHSIYLHKGHQFPALFRSLGGLTVSQSAYERAVSHAVGLSSSCAACYGEAYMCGYNRCFWSCRNAGKSCDDCLATQGCMAAVKSCTGF